MLNFQDIPQYTKMSHYSVNVGWNYLLFKINKDIESDLCPLNLCPDYQRGHVWTEAQQIAYVEFKLRGGPTVDIIHFNCPGWMGDFKGPYELVDGLQRITAAMKFLKNELIVFEEYIRSDYRGSVPSEIEFIFAVNNLETRKEILTWYLELNTGGVVHSDKEISKVKYLLSKER